MELLIPWRRFVQPHLGLNISRFSQCGLKKDIHLRAVSKLYLEQNEDCSLGGSISDSAMRLIQSGSGRQSIYKVLMKGEFNTMKHLFYKRVFVSHEDLMSP